MLPDHAPGWPPEAPVFTVTVAGPERHDGEAPYTYVVHAADEPTARALVLAYHAASNELRMTEFRIDTNKGTVWRFGYDPALQPDVVLIPRHSFPGAPPWTGDTPGQAWRDMRPPAEQAQMGAVLAAERHCLEVAQDFGLDVAHMDIDLSEAPALPARDAVLHVMQLRARCAISPGRLVPDGADTMPFILGTAHIRALTTAICDRDLANGVEPDEVGQILTDANYQAVNHANGTDEDPPPYFHHRLTVDHWALLKAADCYRFQIQDLGTETGVAAHGGVGRLRTELIAALGVDEDDHRMRFEWDAADGWPLLHAVAAPIRRAEALVELYQGFDNIEELSPPDWGQHISDMIADLLRYANDSESMNPWAVLDAGMGHFVEEARQEYPQPQPATLRLLVATAAGQGQQEYDFCNTIDGEIVYPGPCDLPLPNHSCGCLESLVGVDTGRRTTTFTVAEVAITRTELHRVLAKAQNLTEADPGYADVPELAADMLAVASHFPIGAVLGRSHRRYRRRRTSAAPSDPPTAGADAPDAEEELKPWTVRVRTRRDHEFTVEASDEDSAMDAAWSSFDEDRDIIDHDTDVHVGLAA